MADKDQVPLEDLIEELEAISDDIKGCKFENDPEHKWKCEKCPDGVGECMFYNSSAISVLCLHIVQLYKSLDTNSLETIKKAVQTTMANEKEDKKITNKKIPDEMFT